MQTYVVLRRGINVGGRNRVPMVEPRIVATPVYGSATIGSSQTTQLLELMRKRSAPQE
jgi:hypothetical protein